MVGTRYEFSSILFRWENRVDRWMFARVPPEISAEIDAEPHPPAGFGSIKVEVATGSSRWRTSIFPENATQTYVLPVKAAILTAEQLAEGDTIQLSLTTVTGAP